MRVFRLSLRNYRVFEQPLEIEIPSGLVGIYGPNGAGKSYFIEAIPWILFGKSRTSVSDIRTNGATTDCETEIEFEHESHLYKIRRSILPRGLVKAKGWIDDELISDGVKETNRFVQSSLGMDIEAFRSSVFAEQRQVASFSDATPAERQKLVLSLLGITPLDRARDLARSDFRNRSEQLKLARAAVPPTEGLVEQIVEQQQQLDGVRKMIDQVDQTGREINTELRKVGEELEILRGSKNRRDQVIAVGKEKRRLYQQLSAQREQFKSIQIRSAEVTQALEVKRSELVDCSELEKRAATLKIELQEINNRKLATQTLNNIVIQSGYNTVTELRNSLDSLKIESQSIAKRKAELVLQVGDLDAQFNFRSAELVKKEAKFKQMKRLGAGSLCPTCNQTLGDAFESHLSEVGEEIEAEKNMLDELNSRLRFYRKQIEDCDHKVAEFSSEIAKREDFLTQATTAEEKVESLMGLGNEPDVVAQLHAVEIELSNQRQLRDQIVKLEAELSHIESTMMNFGEFQQNLDRVAKELDQLRDELSGIEFNPDYFTEIEMHYQYLSKESVRLTQQTQKHQISSVQIQGVIERYQALLDQASKSREIVTTLEVEVGVIGRVSDYLSEFRRSVIASLGPRLASSAASLFSELTESEYDYLDVDTGSWDIRISDSGHSFELGRFSGSERDLANLAFRIAISEQIGLSFGEHLGLLVLDEVFGPLDDQRRFTMLGALDRLKSRFNQVIVVTHGSDIKEQMPGAIEIVKLGQRRATAHVV